jgi:hypothetical protein
MKKLTSALLVLGVFLTTAFACSSPEPWTDYSTMSSKIKSTYICTVDFRPNQISASPIQK